MLLCAGTAQAWSYHSFAYGYSISLPDDWAQVPEEVLAVKMAQLPTTQSGAGRLDVAFQPKRNGKWFEQPYLLVEIVPYAGLGFTEQVDDAQIQQIVQTNTGLDPANPFHDDTQVLEGGGEVEGSGGSLKLDRNARRFVWSSSTSSAGTGVLRTRQWGFFGKDSLVLITLHEKDKGSDRLRDLAREVAGSFQFEIGRDYQPAVTVGDVTRDAVTLLTTPNRGMIVTLFCVAVAAACAAYSIASNRRRELAYRQYSPFDDR